MVDSLALLRAMDGISDSDIINTGKLYINASTTRRTNKKKLLSFALAAALILSLGTAAYAFTRRAAVHTEEIYFDGDKHPAIGFESLDEAPVSLGVWSLGELPEDFTLSKSYYRGNEARTDYQNPAGDIISLIYQKPGNSPESYFNAEILKREEVSVNGNSGVYYLTDNGWQYVFWTVEERGIGMRLSVKGDYNALALANAVYEADEHPPIDADTAAALTELGTWQIALPSGYSELVIYGVAGEYGYIYRVYTNSYNDEIVLNYERSATSLNGYVNYYRSAEARYGKIHFTELSINGYKCWLLENEDGTPFRLTWQNTDSTLTFTLTASKLTSEELINIAQCINNSN